MQIFTLFALIVKASQKRVKPLSWQEGAENPQADTSRVAKAHMQPAGPAPGIELLS